LVEVFYFPEISIVTQKSLNDVKAPSSSAWFDLGCLLILGGVLVVRVVALLAKRRKLRPMEFG
jgi:hypothetical protein